jgi:hypothetical protein
VIDPRVRYPQLRCLHRPRLFEEKIRWRPDHTGRPLKRLAIARAMSSCTSKMSFNSRS